MPKLLFRPQGYTGAVEPLFARAEYTITKALSRAQKELSSGTLRLEKRPLKALAAMLIEFAEDLLCDIGIWRALERSNAELFGTELPFRSETSAAPSRETITPSRIRHFLWLVYPQFVPGLVLPPDQADLGVSGASRRRSLAERTMNNPSRRRFTLLDALIVVAWAALGFGAARVLMDVSVTMWPDKYRVPWWMWTGAGCMMLMSMNLCVLNLRFVRPRPSVRRLARQPGFIAGVAVAWSVVFQTVSHAAMWLIQGSPINATARLNNYLVMISDPGHISAFVILGWIILLLQQRPKSQLDWIERLGSLLGCLTILGWILSIALMIVLL